ncbi:AraC family transcriptional regulator [Niveibacterium sp. SC-1]|uniref:AraC family transcriptional regulator n=1 Tax=Niveibacterium sp. SC-1 TaxID=3135646 RepID=UPI00311FDEA0
MGRPHSPVGQNLARLNRVVDLVEANLDRVLVLDELARAAAFSPFHFHRVFHELYGETPRDFVRRRRLEHGASLLHYSRSQIGRIATACGFGTADGFTRAFRHRFGVSPVQWRQHGFAQWQNRWSPPPDIVFDTSRWNVRVVTLPAVRVAYRRHIGPYGSAGESQWLLLGEWMEDMRICGLTRYGIGMDNPAITPGEHCRYDICTELPAGFVVPPRTPVRTIPGGRYAILEYAGPPQRSGEAWVWLLEEWLPASGYNMDRMLCFERYLPDMRNPGPEDQSCELCVLLGNPMLI